MVNGLCYFNIHNATFSSGEIRGQLTGICGPTPTPSPTGTPGVTPTPSPGPAQAINLSTRLFVQAGDNVGIGGFIITGTSPKEVLLRAIGPSLSGAGINALADPVMELHGPGGFATIINNNWRSDQEAEIQATGIPPTNDLESAILVTLDPGAYTAIVKGNGTPPGTGVGLVEIYDLDQAVASKLGNISTRAFVNTGNDIVIAGFILGNGTGDDKVVVRGIGPSLTAFGVPNALADPTLELRNSDGALLVSNDDWQDDPVQAAELTALNLAPTNDLESGIVSTLAPGAYTALLAGLNNGTGVGLVEVYDNPVAVPTPTPTPGAACTENFDGVTAPALPAGWVATNPDPGDGVLWVTTTTNTDTTPNAAFIQAQDEVSDKVLDSPLITVNSATAQLSFRNNFDLEFSDGIYGDGGVLEVSSPNISGGAFLDITDPLIGGSITSGGYTGEIKNGRMVWGGASGGYINTVANLGHNVHGQTIKLRFRMITDEAVVSPGWWVDTLSITGASCQ